MKSKVVQIGVAAARQAALVFALGSLVAIAAVPVAFDRAGALLLLAALGAGALAVALKLPWRTWSPRATLVLLAPAVAILGCANSLGLVPVRSYGVFFVLLFAWIGMHHPPRTALTLAPLMALGYTVPVALAPGEVPLDVRAILVAITVGVLVAETMSRQVAAVTDAQRQAEHVARDEHARSIIYEHASLTDELTGLGNRRRASELLADLRPGDTVALIDVDRFKTVNDVHGHEAGDALLRELAEFLLTNIRAKDHVVRYGGEEFLLVLPKTSLGGAAHVLERFRNWWELLSPMTTFSTGAAECWPSEASRDTLARADEALYRAKREGRNRVEV